MKKSLFALAAVAALSLVFASCNLNGGDKPGDDPTAGGSTGAKLTQSAACAATDVTENADGSVSGVTASKYSGGCVAVFINADKTPVEAGKTVAVKFAFEAVKDAWSDASLKPKFAIAAGNDTDKYYEFKGSAAAYKDGSDASGEIEAEITLDAASDVVKVQFNAFQWPGDTENDKVKITIKSVEVK